MFNLMNLNAFPNAPYVSKTCTERVHCCTCVKYLKYNLKLCIQFIQIYTILYPKLFIHKVKDKKVHCQSNLLVSSPFPLSPGLAFLCRFEERPQIFLGKASEFPAANLKIDAH